MRIKLDENLGRQCASELRKAGHDIATACEEHLCSAGDREIASACKRESRCLVTLDLDFANPLVFRPRDFCGLAVLRLPPRASQTDLLQAIWTLAAALKSDSIHGQLWVIARGSVRVYQPDS
jgi:predicted nuclease of predicted toxin-antitoxin system